MFVLTKLKKELRIAPQKLSLPLLEAVTSEIQTLFFDKVLKDLGLCVTLYDVRSVEGGFVFPGDGAPRFTVEFQLVMLRPFIGEVLTGKLKKCDKSGLYSMFPKLLLPDDPKTLREIWYLLHVGGSASLPSRPLSLVSMPANLLEANEQKCTACHLETMAQEPCEMETA